MVKAVIFDFDGVIHNTLNLAFSINRKISPSLTLEEFKNWFNGNIYQKANFSLEHMDAFFTQQDEQFKTLDIDPLIKEELEKISQKFRLYIITSNREKSLGFFFEHNAMEHLFSRIIGEETEKSKAIKFQMLLEEENLTHEDCVFITDTLGDIKEASSSNVRTIAVDFGFHERERLERGNPYRILSSFDEILPLLE